MGTLLSLHMRVKWEARNSPAAEAYLTNGSPLGGGHPHGSADSHDFDLRFDFQVFLVGPLSFCSTWETASLSSGSWSMNEMNKLGNEVAYLVNLLLSGYFTELQWALVQCFVNYGCDSLMVCEVILVGFHQPEIHTHTHTHTHTHSHRWS